jgi:transposase, IS5 family
LKKITSRCGSRAIEALNEALLEKAASNKVLKTDRVRADTTVVPADVAYPTDSSLMARGVVRMVALVAVLHGLGLAARTQMRDRGRSMRRRAHDMGAWLRRRTDAAKEEVKAINAEMADLAELSLVEAAAVARNARRSLARPGQSASGKAHAAVNELETLVGRLERVVAQTRLRLAGQMPEGASRLVSLHDGDARPIRKGRLGKPVEFGFLAQVVDNADGIVLDHEVLVGNPADGPLLAPAVARIKKLVGRAPRAVTADRGYGDAKVTADVESHGVKTVAIVRKGRPGAARQKLQRSTRFVKLIKWRTGSEGRISSLKRDFGWGRSLMDGVGGARAWCGYGIFANNAIKISRLTTGPAQPAPDPTPPSAPKKPRPAATGPPRSSQNAA